MGFRTGPAPGNPLNAEERARCGLPLYYETMRPLSNPMSEHEAHGRARLEALAAFTRPQYETQAESRERYSNRWHRIDIADDGFKPRWCDVLIAPGHGEGEIDQRVAECFEHISSESTDFEIQREVMLLPGVQDCVVVSAGAVAPPRAKHRYLPRPAKRLPAKRHIRDGIRLCARVLWLALRTLAAFVWEWVKPMPRLAPQGTRKASQSGRFYGYGGTFLHRRIRPSTKASTAEPFEWDTLYR